MPPVSGGRISRRLIVLHEIPNRSAVQTNDWGIAGKREPICSRFKVLARGICDITTTTPVLEMVAR
jgi:hypothetical protein